MLGYLGSGSRLHDVVKSALIFLVARLTKQGWLEHEPSSETYPMRSITDDVKGLISGSSSGPNGSIGIDIIHAVVQERRKYGKVRMR